MLRTAVSCHSIISALHGRESDLLFCVIGSLRTSMPSHSALSTKGCEESQEKADDKANEQKDEDR